jgi:hypothetical protein
MGNSWDVISEEAEEEGLGRGVFWVGRGRRQVVGEMRDTLLYLTLKALHLNKYSLKKEYYMLKILSRIEIR